MEAAFGRTSPDPAAAFARLEALERRRAVRDLRRATSEGGFSLSLTACHVLAPKEGQHTLRGAEVALRWPRRVGMSSAGGLLPLIASSGLSFEVGAWLLDAACAAACRWPHQEATVSIDASAACLADASLLQHVADALQGSGLAAGRLEIEIAEPALAACGADGLFILAALADRGVGVALDHFGADSANLLTLKHLPLATVKLDRSIIRDLPYDRGASAVAGAIIDCAHGLQARVVAIGVETEAQRDALAQLGCDFAQGALYGPALTADNFAAVLHAGASA